MLSNYDESLSPVHLPLTAQQGTKVSESFGLSPPLGHTNS